MHAVRIEPRHAGSVRRWSCLLLAGALLAACATPVGQSQELRGTYRENALVTNPNGGGPSVVRWGPPEPYNPASRD